MQAFKKCKIIYLEKTDAMSTFKQQNIVIIKLKYELNEVQNCWPHAKIDFNLVDEHSASPRQLNATAASFQSLPVAYGESVKHVVC